MTKEEILALSGQPLHEAVLEQVLGWRKLERAEIEGGGVVEGAWVDETAGWIKISSRSATPDVTKGEWPGKLVRQMCKVQNLRLTGDFAGGEFVCLFALKATAATPALMIGDAEFGTAVARAALLAVQV